MVKPEWGSRYTCFSCGCKFYDLNRPEPLCPRCGVDQREATAETRPTRQSRATISTAKEETEQDLLEEPTEPGIDQEVTLDDEEEEEEEEEY
ncbi:MAG: FYDLN acid domain-containing protein [Nitrospinota bacterium]